MNVVAWPTLMSALAFCTLCFGHANAAGGPRPPCEDISSPAFAPVGRAPNYLLWTESDWTPPPCTGWISKESVVVAVAGEFHFDGTTDDLLKRFGGISTLTSVRYWSVTENDWRTLITSAAALQSPDPADQRADFTATEMGSGKDLFFTETDNRLGEPVIYRMRVTATVEGLVITIENVNAVRRFMLPLVSPGDLQSIHYLQRIAPETWTYYALARTAKPSLSAFGVVRNESYVNRAFALYSHFTNTVVDPLRRIQ
jgi:hypothetical protein